MLVGHLDTVVVSLSFDSFKNLERTFPLHKYLIFTGWQQDQDVISLFEGSVLGLVIEVSFLSDLTSTKLIMGEISCFLESVA